MSLLQLLLERNVANVQEINRYVEQLSQRARTPHGKLWVQRTLRKWLINTHPRVSPIKVAPNNAPDWLKSAIGRGETVVNVIVDNNLTQKINHIVDYFNANPNERLDRVSVEQAFVAADKWVQQMNKNASDTETDKDSQVVYTFNNGYKIVKLITQRGFSREGRLMNHCVASYYEEYEDGECEIYSLRDPQNKPHVTFEYDKKSRKVEQIQGKGDTLVKDAYLTMIGEFFRHKNWKLGNSLREDEYLNVIMPYGIPKTAKSLQRIANDILSGNIPKDELIQYEELKKQTSITFKELEKILLLAMMEDSWHRSYDLREDPTLFLRIKDSLSSITELNCGRSDIPVAFVTTVLPNLKVLKSEGTLTLFDLQADADLPTVDVFFDSPWKKIFTDSDMVLDGVKLDAPTVNIISDEETDVSLTNVDMTSVQKLEIDVYSNKFVLTASTPTQLNTVEFSVFQPTNFKFENLNAKIVKPTSKAFTQLTANQIELLVDAFPNISFATRTSKRYDNRGRMLNKAKVVWKPSAESITVPLELAKSKLEIASHEMKVSQRSVLRVKENALILAHSLTGMWKEIEIGGNLTFGVRSGKHILPDRIVVGGNLYITDNVIVPETAKIEGEIYIVATPKTKLRWSGDKKRVPQRNSKPPEEYSRQDYANSKNVPAELMDR